MDSRPSVACCRSTRAHRSTSAERAPAISCSMTRSSPRGTAACTTEVAHSCSKTSTTRSASSATETTSPIRERSTVPTSSRSVRSGSASPPRARVQRPPSRHPRPNRPNWPTRPPSRRRTTRRPHLSPLRHHRGHLHHPLRHQQTVHQSQSQSPKQKLNLITTRCRFLKRPHPSLPQPSRWCPLRTSRTGARIPDPSPNPSPNPSHTPSPGPSPSSKHCLTRSLNPHVRRRRLRRHQTLRSRKTQSRRPTNQESPTSSPSRRHANPE